MPCLCEKFQTVGGGARFQHEQKGGGETGRFVNFKDEELPEGKKETDQRRGELIIKMVKNRGKSIGEKRTQEGIGGKSRS